MLSATLGERPGAAVVVERLQYIRNGIDSIPDSRSDDAVFLQRKR
jgi:hypothetical protein